MSISYRTGSIFEQPDLDGIAHQCNTFGHFGGGIARVIREFYPEASESSKGLCKFAEDEGKNLIGSWECVKCPGVGGGKNFIEILNCYTQEGMGGEKRNTRYDALADLLPKIRGQMENRKDRDMSKGYKLGVPYGFGSGLAKGSWIVVEAIFKSAFADSKVVEIIIVEDPRYSHTARK